MSEEKEVLIGFLIGSISILRDINIQFTEKSRNKLADKIMELLTDYEKEKAKNKEQYKEFIKEHGEVCEQIKEDINKYWQDKIKAKIEELEKLNAEATGNGFGFAIYYLQSLLEKE